MYPNLLGQKSYYKITDEEMGKLIGVSRNAYSQKMKNGRFYPRECQIYCDFFNKSFEYLFALEKDLLKIKEKE